MTSTAIAQKIDTRSLLSMGRELELPATLDICLDNAAVSEPLELLTLFRVLPERRLVALARWRDQVIVAKLFFSRGRWQQHLERETRGIELVMRKGIPTPALLSSGTSLDGGTGIVLMEYLTDSASVEKCWQESAPAQREVLLQRVVDLIALCHSRGLLQKDIHLNNFLLQNDSLFLLDAAAVEAYGDANGSASTEQGGVDSVKALQNLALFFAQFPVINDALVPALYEYYRAQRPLADISADLGLFAALLRKKRLLRLKVVTDKLYRSTSANACISEWSRFVVYRRDLESSALKRLIAAPDLCMEAGQFLKKGNSSTVAVIRLDGRQCVIKRYNIKSFWHGLRRLFRPSRAWVSWRNAHMLEMFGVSTPKPLLMMERRIGMLRREAYFLCEYAEGEDSLRFLEKEPINSPVWSLVLDQFKSLFLLMQEYGIVHGDMKATNFISTEQQLTVLDLDVMRQESDARRFIPAFRKDLQRFADNWKGHPEKRAQVHAMIEHLLTDTEQDNK